MIPRDPILRIIIVDLSLTALRRSDGHLFRLLHQWQQAEGHVTRPTPAAFGTPTDRDLPSWFPPGLICFTPLARNAPSPFSKCIRSDETKVAMGFIHG